MRSHIIVVSVLGLFVFLLLGLSYSDYLSKIDDLSLFLYSDKFFVDCMSMPGGLLDYAGCFLTQLFHFPWIGALAYALCFAGLMLVAYKSLRMPASLFGMACVPGAMALLTMLSLGYMLFTFKPIGFAFSNLIGYAVACGMFWLYRRCSNVLARAFVGLAIVVLGYPLFGFYSLLSTAMCLLSELGRQRVKNNSSKGWIVVTGVMIALLAAIAVVPWLYYLYRTTYLLPSYIYRIGLPDFYPDELVYYLPTAIACAFMLTGAAVSLAWSPQREKAQWTRYASLGVMAAAIASIFIFRNNDDNFKLTLQLDRAVHACDWDAAIALAEANKAEPTRLNVLLTDIALMRKGEAGSRMFKFQNGCAPYLTTRVATTMRDAGSILLNYHFGRIYNAYRWGMEYLVGYGMRAEHLKMMAKCAIINGEYALAQKYLDTLAQTWVWKDWAEHYRTYLENPELAREDAEMAAILPLTEFADHLEGDGGKIETYLLPALSKLQGGNAELMELSMQCSLMQKDLDKFMTKLRDYVISHDDSMLPDHYQEAAILWSLLNKNRLYRRLNINDALETKFNNFIRLNQQYGNLDQDVAAERMRPLFGDTYWFYFFYNNDLKTY